MDPATAIQLGIGIVSAVGAYAGAYAAMKSKLDVMDQRLGAAEREIQGLREAKHHHADQITEVRALVMRRDKQP